MIKETHHNLLFFLMLLSGFLLRLYLSWRPLAYLDNLFIPDDAYISLTIARNIASGLGITFDGIHPSNGFQCLYVFLLTPFYLLSADDILTPIHLALTFSSLCDIVTLILVYNIVLRLSDKPSALLSTFLWCFSPSIISNTLNGLETALNVFLIALCTYFYITKIRGKKTVPAYYFLLGLLLGFLLLARVDSLFFVLALSLDLLWIHRPLAQAITHQSFLKNITRIAAGALVVLLPWWLIELYYLNSLVPESLKSLQIHLSFRPIFPGWNFFLSLYHLANFPLLAGSRLKFHFFALMASASPAIQLMVLTLIALIIAALLCGVQRFLKKITSGNVVFLLIFSLFLLLFYNLYLPVFWFFKRYYHPIALTIVIYCGLIFFFLSKRWLRNRSTLCTSVCIAICYILIAYACIPSLKFFIWGTPEHTVDRDIFGAKGYYLPAKTASKTIPPGARVGAFQSGAIGYFMRENLVFNLDGKVNRSALSALRERRMFEYIHSQKIEYLITWDFNLDYFLLQSSRYSKEYIGKRLLHLADLPSQGKQVFRIYKVNYHP